MICSSLHARSALPFSDFSCSVFVYVRADFDQFYQGQRSSVYVSLQGSMFRTGRLVLQWTHFFQAQSSWFEVPPEEEPIKIQYSFQWLEDSDSSNRQFPILQLDYQTLFKKLLTYYAHKFVWTFGWWQVQAVALTRLSFSSFFDRENLRWEVYPYFDFLVLVQFLVDKDSTCPAFR